MSRTPTEQSHDPAFREINLSAEARRLWGQKWNTPELSYQFGDRKFYLAGQDLYSTTEIIDGFLLWRAVTGADAPNQPPYLVQSNGGRIARGR